MTKAEDKPYREARWKGQGMGDYMCGLCNYETSRRTHYCPECGAVMDEWKEDMEEEELFKIKESELLNKINNNIELSTEELMALVYSEAVEEEIEGDTHRWTREIKSIVTLGGRYFAIEWDKGLTEMQDDEFYEQPYEVEKKEKTIVVNEWEVKEKDKPWIYAVDFDGTLCENQYPNIGKPNMPLINLLKEAKNENSEIILYTMREGEVLDKAVEWCRSYGLEFDAVNDNLPRMKKFFKNNPRKIYANTYIDDHNIKGDLANSLPFVADEKE